MTTDSTKQFRLGVALSGGGARGFAHAGAIKALEEAGYHPDIIAGASAGAVIAVLYSAGITPDRITELFTKSKFTDLCRLRITGRGIFDMSRFRTLIAKAIAPIHNLEELRIPTYIGVTDFDNGLAHAFSTGPIAERIAASCSIPVAFPPVRIDGVNYVDGGVLHNLPAWIIRDKCEHLIGINCSPQPYGKSSGNSLLDTAIRSFHMLARANTIHDLELCDTIIATDKIADYKVSISRTYSAASTADTKPQQKRLKKISIPPHTYSKEQPDIQPRP